MLAQQRGGGIDSNGVEGVGVLVTSASGCQDLGNELGFCFEAADEVGLVGELGSDDLMATSRSTAYWRAR